MPLNHFHVYGTLAYPAHAMNLADRVSEIAASHHKPFIIAIDACLGQESNVGSLTIQDASLFIQEQLYTKTFQRLEIFILPVS